eukprot:5632269-Amphidinium_carterae.1
MAPVCKVRGGGNCNKRLCSKRRGCVWLQCAAACIGSPWSLWRLVWECTQVPHANSQVHGLLASCTSRTHVNCQAWLCLSRPDDSAHRD